MCLGKTHDRLIYLITPIAIAVTYTATRSLLLSGIVGISHLGSGLFLSPDLDTYSIPYKRWGLLRWYWLPYQRMFKHRGISHAVVFGSITRLIYLLPLLLLGCVVMGVDAIKLVSAHPIAFTAVLVGVEAGAIVHLACDRWSSRK